MNLLTAAKRNPWPALNIFGSRFISLQLLCHKLLLVALCSCILCSCKDDKSISVSADASQIEKDYFEDYVSPQHKWGYIDQTGKVIIDPVFDDVKDMKYKLTAANMKGKWGYIDNKGRTVIPFQYKQAYNFVEEKTFVQDFDNKWTLIDQKGQAETAIKYDAAEPYKNGYAIVTIGLVKGAIDTKGQEVLPPSYQALTALPDNRFIAKDGQLTSIINKEGIKLMSDYDKVYFPANGSIRVKKNGKYGYVREDNYSQLGDLIYDKAEDFHYESTIVKQAGLYRLIDKNLKEQIEYPYEKIEYLGENFWKYKSGKSWGIINAAGEAITSAKFEDLHRYSDGMVAYKTGELWGYANKLGLKIIPAKYQLAWDFHKGKARVIDKRGVGFIDITGKMVIPDIFLEVRDFYANKARFQTY